VRYAIAAGAWLGITVLAFGANRALVDEPKHYWYSTLAIADIAGTLAWQGFVRGVKKGTSYEFSYVN